LWLFNLSENDNNAKWVKIKAYELKKEYFTKEIDKKIVYKNLSYFTVDKYPDFYEEKEVSCINLSMAKLIKWKIYINGDMASFLKLKKIAGKRKIFELVANIFFTLKDDEKLKQIWNIFYVPENNTSNACPICSLNQWNIYKLFWHGYWPMFEHSMHHLDDEEYEQLKNSWILKKDDNKKTHIKLEK